MSKLLGFGLILTGMVIGGVAVPLSASSLTSRDAAVAVVPAGANPGAAANPISENPAARDVRALAVPALKPLPMAAASTTPPADTPHAAAPLRPREPHPALRPPAAPAARKPILPAFETVTVAEEPAAITRAVQAELARVGCYPGAVTGVWGPETRRAMKAFTNRVNATLPVDKPDIILLSLVKAQPGTVCGKACPAGQEGGADGRCVPKAVLAQAARKTGTATAKAAGAMHAPTPVATNGALKPKDEAKVTVAAAAPVIPLATAPAVTAPVFEDTPRMALAGPKPREEIAAALVTPTSVTPAALEKPAKPVRKREHKEAPAAKTSFGQTRWARDFFRNAQTF